MRKKYDLEFHFYLRELMPYLETRDTPPMIVQNPRRLVYREGVFLPLFQVPGRDFSAEDILCGNGEMWIQSMDEAGIDTAVLSTSSLIEELPRNEAVYFAKKTNDYAAEMMQRYPGRFLGTACLPSPYVDEAIREMERCKNELGFSYWHTHSNYGKEFLYEEKYLPLLAKAEELGFAIYLHPHFSMNEDMLGAGFAYPGAGLGFGQDVMKTAVRLVINGTFDRFPKLKLIMGHLGEYFPFILERINNRFMVVHDLNVKMQHPFSYYFENKNLFVTTSGNASAAAFECTKKVIGIDNILFASDYPFEEYKESVDFINNLDLTDEEKEKIFCGNTEKYIL